MTIHPDVSGRPQVLLMLERLIAYMMTQPGVRFVTLEEMVLDFKARFPRKGAKAPKGVKAQAKAEAMRLIGVDVGGTFTDLVLADTETGPRHHPQGADDAGGSLRRRG